LEPSVISTGQEISGQQTLIPEIQGLILEKLSIRVESPKSDLFQTGVFDSLTLVQFILHLEEHFGLHLPMGDLDFESFVSIERMAELVANHTGTNDSGSRSQTA
jgi:acyl carrier protein